MLKYTYAAYLPTEERYGADRLTAHSGALRASMKNTDGESILAERAALTQALGSAHVISSTITFMHVQRNQTLTFYDDRQVLTGSWISTRF